MGCSASSRVPSFDPAEYRSESAKTKSFARAMERQAFVVIKASYFENCLARACSIGHRSEIEPTSFYSGHQAVRTWFQDGYKFLTAFSYSWLSPDHPDPNNFHLPSIVGVIQAMRATWGTDPGIILDYCSLWQGTRNKLQQELFDEAMNYVAVPWEHSEITAVKLTATPDSEPRCYDDRGWTKFESDLIDRKPPKDKDVLNRLTCSSREEPWDEEGLRRMACFPRRPPLEPGRWVIELDERRCRVEAKGLELFSRRKDLNFVVSTYRMAYEEMASSSIKFAFPGFGWGLQEAQLLAEALPNCQCLHTLDLSFNDLGKAGIEAMAPALPELLNLQILNLSATGVSNDGAEVLALYLGRLLMLNDLDLSRNEFDIAGARALATVLHHLRLHTLKLSGNKFDHESAEVLAPSFGGLRRLQTLHLDGNDFGSKGEQTIRMALPPTRVDLVL